MSGETFDTMKCGECGYNNPSSVRLCRSCGSVLARTPVPKKRPAQRQDIRPKNTIVSARDGLVTLRKDIGDFKRAGFFIRFLAMTIDLFFVTMLDGALLFGGAMLIGKTTGIIDTVLTSEGFEFFKVISPLLKTALISVVCVPPLYFIVMTTLFGQTIGKMICGIRVVRSDGRPVSPLRALARFLAYIPSGALLFAGFLWVLWDPERQGWHDMLADPVVIRL
jgi:uncharacterized RDD family membrane protein YckC